MFPIILPNINTFVCRYALQLIATSHILAIRRKSEVVTVDHIREAYGLFMDVDRSRKFIESNQEDFLFNTKSISPNDCSMDLL